MVKRLKRGLLYVVGMMLFTPTVAKADIVGVTFGLTAPSATENRLALSLLGGSTFTDLTGTFYAEIDIDLTTGVVSSIDIISGSIVASDWSMITGIGTVSGTPSDATMDTIPALSAVTAGTFAADEQVISLIGGTVSAPGAGFSQDFAVDPLSIPGSGIGTISSTLNSGVFNLVFSLPIDDQQTIAPGANLSILGSLVATGSVSAVPEPSSLMLLCGSACVGGFYRRRATR